MVTIRPSVLGERVWRCAGLVLLLLAALDWEEWTREGAGRPKLQLRVLAPNAFEYQLYCL